MLRAATQDTINMPHELSLYFLGTGNAQSLDLGNASCVLERDSKPLLAIDCGPDTVRLFGQRYMGELPGAIFITHAHMDHIGGLESLFYKLWFNDRQRQPVKLFVPVRLVELLHKRVGDYPNVLAEGGANFWDAFQLIPVGEQFWHEGLRFHVFPVRHHEFQTAYGLSLSGRFVFTGDTCPIPEVLNHFACHGEAVFHDCALKGNPSHTGVDDLARSYKPELLSRLVLYHYESRQAGDYMEQLGYRVARPGQRFTLGATHDGVPTPVKKSRCDQPD